MSRQVGVFIDIGNQFHCVQKKWPGKKLNYEEYLHKAKTFGSIFRAFAYGTQVEDTAAKFITALRHIGFDPQYKEVDKGAWYSWNVGIAVDIVRYVIHNKIDIIVLGSSDRGMDSIISWAKEQGVRVIVMGCSINKDLKNVCDQWVEISENMLTAKIEEPDDDEDTDAAE